VLIWLCAAFLVVAVVGGATVAGLRGWRLYKAFRDTSSRTADAVARVTDAAMQAERRATSLAESTERLNRAIARLQESLAELAVLRAATDDVRNWIAVVRALVPTK